MKNGSIHVSNVVTLKTLRMCIVFGNMFFVRLFAKVGVTYQAYLVGRYNINNVNDCNL